jgi:hypothetical protein
VFCVAATNFGRCAPVQMSLPWLRVTAPGTGARRSRGVCGGAGLFWPRARSPFGHPANRKRPHEIPKPHASHLSPNPCARNPPGPDGRRAPTGAGELANNLEVVLIAIVSPMIVVMQPGVPQEKFDPPNSGPLPAPRERSKFFRQRDQDRDIDPRTNAIAAWTSMPLGTARAAPGNPPSWRCAPQRRFRGQPTCRQMSQRKVAHRMGVGSRTIG